MESGSGKSGAEDGTDEKLVSQEEQQLNEVTKDKSEVKYSTSEIQNGETKMDCDMRKAFVGMGKEELMKFANDPFWVLTRQFLFALFWIMWVGMLVGSIAIVIYSPKCTSSKKPWFKDSLVYKFDIKAFEYGSMHNRIGDLKALKDHLHYLEYLGVDSVLVDSLMECSADRITVKDFKKIDSAYGSFEILKDLTDKMKKKGIHLVMSFDPNYSSDKHEWFRNSIARIDPYTNYYVWAQGSFSSEDGSMVLPNNWRSVTGGIAWTYVKERGQFYLHQFSSHQPDLNFREHKVADYFKDVLLFWLDFGLSGVHINNVKFLVEDENLTNETINPVPGATHEDYNFFSHIKTTNNPLTSTIIRDWSDAVESNGKVLSVNDFNPTDPNSHLIVYHTMKLDSFINATEFDESIKTNLLRMNPTWQWECRRMECPDEVTSKALVNIFLLLPGIAVIRGGEELPWPSSTNQSWSSEVLNGSLKNDFDYFLKTIDEEKAKPESYLNNLKKIIKLRKSETFKSGSIEHKVVNSTIFSFTRVLSDQGYLVVLNFDDDSRSGSFDSFTSISSNTQLTLWMGPKTELEEENSQPRLTIPGKTFAVFTFSVATVVTSL